MVVMGGGRKETNDEKIPLPPISPITNYFLPVTSYSCSICGTKFEKSDNLEEHMNQCSTMISDSYNMTDNKSTDPYFDLNKVEKLLAECSPKDLIEDDDFHELVIDFKEVDDTLPDTAITESIAPGNNLPDFKFSCYLCSEKISNEASLGQHLMEKHEEDEKDEATGQFYLEEPQNGRENNRRFSYKKEVLVLACGWEDCTQIFRNLDDLEDHVDSHLGYLAVGEVTGCMWGSCRIEGQLVELKRHLAMHCWHQKLKCHGQNYRARELLDQCKRKPSSLPQGHMTKFVCNWSSCSEGGFIQPWIFFIHVNSHADEEEDLSCLWNGCTIRKSFSHPSTLKVHILGHTGEKLLACPDCGRVFANRLKFTDHCQRQKKTDELLKITDGNFPCDECGKCFKLERILKDHKRAHLKPYQCNECGHYCPTPSTLKTHIIYKHTKERNFKCPECKYSGKTSIDLTGHLKKHDKKGRQCKYEDCTFATATNYKLKRHYEKEHDEKPEVCVYSCHICTETFPNGNFLTKHLKTLHSLSSQSRLRFKKDIKTGVFFLKTE